MNLAKFKYAQDPYSGIYHPNSEKHPALYPGNELDKYSVPEEIQEDYARLNTCIETKYPKEFLKVCATYNKLFPSLRSGDWTYSSYNASPLTLLDQERTDTGTGISSNYLKQIIDQVTARLGTITFDPKLLSDTPTLEYIMYKDEVERLLRQSTRSQKLNKMALEMFHDGSILGFSHAIIDPFTHEWTKVNDYEAGLYESQFNRGNIRQFLYRNYAFPVVDLPIYLQHCDKSTRKKFIEEIGTYENVDFKLYFDCPRHKVWCIINDTVTEPLEYPFSTVQMVTFKWDLGFTNCTATSLFDIMYPLQREINHVNAKRHQLVRLYKGAVPVFNSDVDLSMKNITNGSGECLYVDSARPIDTLMTVINPTPLDSGLDALVTSYKSEMLEIAGINNMSFDMENMRSAATVVALNQATDSVFQSQMLEHASTVSNMFITEVNYKAGINIPSPTGVKWSDIKTLLDTANVDLQPVHVTDPMGNLNTAEDAVLPNYVMIQMSRYAVAVARGEVQYENLSYLQDKAVLVPMVAMLAIKMDALGVSVPDHVHKFLFTAFVNDIQLGIVQLAQSEEAPTEEEVPPAEEGAQAA